MKSKTTITKAKSPRTLYQYQKTQGVHYQDEKGFWEPRCQKSKGFQKVCL